MNLTISAASSWVTRWCSTIAPKGLVLDMACGPGRHARFLLERGFRVLAVDWDISSVEDLRGQIGLEIRQADLENRPWPFADGWFDGLVVTNYLHRPLFSSLIAALKPGGVLIYETFAQGNGEFGRPSNPDYLLRPGELLDVARTAMRVIAYEDVYAEIPKPALIQRICAVKNGAPVQHFRAPGN
jgi:SAM-dependent methyltransferase